MRRSNCSLWPIKGVGKNVNTNLSADGTVDEGLSLNLVRVENSVSAHVVC